ncbi:hypothetical protein ACH4E7_23180 [Kitasatospora sp. NPDC018058]|uniref:hypothetical protein n=1 Tax=Kitasatospora sp. NPDC018058 TaxID=3364025 RepID=UPI0037BF064F
MKVLALGGAGEVGRVAARAVAGLPGVQELVIADRDLEAARRTAALLSASAAVPVRARRVDVMDAAEPDAALGVGVLSGWMGGPAVAGAGERVSRGW